MLYEKADYSFYVAAKVAEMDWVDFVKEPGKREISIFSENAFLDDLETIKKFGN